MTAAQAVQLIVDGFVIGSLYALVGLGVVIVYRATKVLNFASGGVATLAGYTTTRLTENAGLPYAVALIAAVSVGLLTGALIGVVMTKAFTRAGVLERSIASLGLAFVLTWISRTLFGEIAQTAPQVFAGTLMFGDVRLSGHGLYVIVVSGLAILFAMWLVNRTRLGLAMRALSQDAPIARSYGVSNDVVSVASWTIASGLAALSGVLVSSFIQVDQNIMTTISIHSLLALVLGGFGTSGGAIVGGLALGVASSLLVGFLEPAFKNTFVFILVLVTLIVRPQGLVGRKEIVVQESGQASNLPALPSGRKRRPVVILGSLAVAAIVVAVLPFTSLPVPLVTLSILFATATVVISLGFLMGYTGEVSLGHGALASVGGYVTAIVLFRVGELSLPVALMLAVIGAGAVGAVIAWVTLRLSGLYLAIATMTFTGVVIELAQRLRPITGGPLGMGVEIHFGDQFTTQLGIYYLAAAGFLLAAVSFELLLRTRHAVYWVAIRDVPIAALANGVHIRREKVLGFAISSAVAGLGGGLLAIAVSHIGPADYGLNWSFVAILAVVLGGVGSGLGALGGSAVIILLPVAINRTGATELVFGLAIMVLMATAPRGVPGAIDSIRRAVRAARSRRAPLPATGP